MFSVLMLLPLINSITADPSQVNISFLFFSNLTYLNSFLLCLFSIVSSFLVNYFVTRKTNLLISKCGYELASKTFDNLLSKDYSYYQNKDPSSLRQAICLELAQSIVGLFNPIIYILSSSIISLILIISIFIYYPNMVLVLCFSFLLSYPVFKWNQRLAPKTKLYEVKNHTQKLFSIIDILVNSPEELHFSKIKLYLKEYFNKNYSFLVRKEADITFSQYFSKYILDLTLSFILIFLFLFAIYGNNSLINLSKISFSLIILQKLLPYLYQIYTFLMQIRISTPAFETIKIINSNNFTGTTYYQKKFSPIIIQNITSKYINQSLKNPISIKLYSGDRLLLKGPSGSGKSTLLLIISGLIKPDEGLVKLENKEKILGKNMISFVPQKSFCLAGSIAFNIILKETFSSNDMIRLKEVYEVCGLNKDYSFDELFTKILSENLSNISGGQLQRIAISRGIFNKPKYLFLDEPTSSLPKGLSLDIINNISNYLNDSILVYTSHKEYEWIISNKQIELG